MGRTISIGAQGFAQLREQGYFYVDKTGFVRDWWDGGDAVTLICRPRRFGKTLNLSTVECFLSMEHAGRGEELFGGLDIWREERFRELQGTVPVVALTFSDCKGSSWADIRARMCQALRGACQAHAYLLESDAVGEGERALLESVSDDMGNATAAGCLKALCSALERYHGVKPVVLLDEYDTPMQEAWLKGFWNESVDFQRPLFNSTFKANPSLGRGLITGVTRVARESVFSDLNNLEVVTSTSGKYATAFGFTEAETFDALDEMGYGAGAREGVREWYDGFTFGGEDHIYNPWSVINFLEKGDFAAYWANTSGNALVSRLVRTGGGELQADFEELLRGGTVVKTFDEQVVFGELGRKRNAVWALLLATGYLKAVEHTILGDTTATLALTNREVAKMFSDMALDWFDDGTASYPGFTRALLAGDLQEAEEYLNDVLAGCISSFDGGAAGGGASAPENFYHGLVLGMLVDLRGRYEVTSNRESGYGRYDVMLFPLGDGDPALAIEFKVFNPRREATLADTLAAARAQLAEHDYARTLAERGIAPERIREVGFAFSGKEVLIG